MKIDVWSDFVCPFCYIGKRHLEKALAAFPHKDQVEVEFKSYELDPNAPIKSEKSIYEELASKYGQSIEKAREMCANIAHQASNVGLTYHFDTMIPTNTFDAHRLTKFAKTENKDLELTEALLYAFFTKSEHIGDREVLANIAAEVGLDRAKALSHLNDDRAYANEVRADQETAKALGVQGVPFFVLNNKYAISGAQPIETFLAALEKVWEEQQSKPELKPLSTSSGESCSGDRCDN